MKLEIAFKDGFESIILQCASWQISHSSKMIEVYSSDTHVGMILSFDMIRYVRDEEIEIIPDEEKKEKAD